MTILQSEIGQISNPEQYIRLMRLLTDVWNEAGKEVGVDWGKINARLDVDPGPLADIWIVALLRYTFVFRMYLSNWPILLDKARIELDQRGHDTKNMLYGLDQSFTPRQG